MADCSAEQVNERDARVERERLMRSNEEGEECNPKMFEQQWVKDKMAVFHSKMAEYESFQVSISIQGQLNSSAVHMTHDNQSCIHLTTV